VCRVVNRSVDYRWNNVWLGNAVIKSRMRCPLKTSIKSADRQGELVTQKEALMGLKNLLLDISCNKCRDNFIRGIPMFIACCQRVDAYDQQQSISKDRDIKEAQRLYNTNSFECLCTLLQGTRQDAGRPLQVA